MTPRRRKQWPLWWKWELELVSHLHTRMEEREFTEIELRRMMEHATGYNLDPSYEGRWLIPARHQRQRWVIVVEPLPERKRLAVITVYRDA